MIQHFLPPFFWRALQALEYRRIIPCIAKPTKKKPRTEANNMIGMMILIVQDQVWMQGRLDLLQHSPVQPGSSLQHGYMLSPLFFTELLKHGMKSSRKPVSLEPLIKQGSGLGHPVTAARKKSAGGTGRSDTATSR